MFKIQKVDKANKESANISRTIRFPEDLSLVLEAMRYAYKDLEIEENNK